MTHEEEPTRGLAGRVQALAKRNGPVVTLLFLANLITAVSTLATAYGVLWRNTADWRPPEYAKLRSLRGGHTLERFTKAFGPAAYREPFVSVVPGLDEAEQAKLTRHVFRPREEYRVEVITDPGGSTVVYSVTSCDEGFRPSFEVDRNDDRRRFTVTLGTPLADVRPEDPTVHQWMTSTGLRQSAVSQHAEAGSQDGRRSYAWAANDVCPYRSEKQRRASETFWDAWEDWQRGRPRDEDTGVVEGSRRDPATLTLMRGSPINVYAETEPGRSVQEYYPALIGVGKDTAD
ncbi:hypothetical protein ACN20G_29295 (plasmid) [Streptomyces sp. BI20]|uniref:hypothetical protein n=1 Tax=Streptomyces sp. BI20 TaxID=3403460 RepID=UPI003C75A5E6